jgi:hypothetical protein
MLTVSEVVAWAKINNPDLETLASVVDAVNVYVALLPGIDLNEDLSWAATTKFAAILLAARWYQRRSSSNGVEAVSESGPVYVSKYDSDIARLLHIDGFQKPVVA